MIVHKLGIILLVWFTYLVFFVILIVNPNNLINFIILFLVLLLFLMHIGTSREKALRRLSCLWILIIVYCTLVLFIVTNAQLFFMEWPKQQLKDYSL